MNDHDRIFSRNVNNAGLIQWFVRTSEGTLGPYSSWRESRSHLDRHLLELEHIRKMTREHALAGGLGKGVLGLDPL